MSDFSGLGDGFAEGASNEEWDAAWAAYSAGERPEAGRDTPPLGSVIELPIGLVEVRGDDPGVGLCLVTPERERPLRQRLGQTPIDSHFDGSAFNDVSDSRAGSDSSGMDYGGTNVHELAALDPVDASSVALTLELESSESSSIHYTITASLGNEVSQGVIGDSESAIDLLELLVSASIEADPVHVYLNAACLEIAGRGVLIVADDISASDETCRSLIESGANYLTDSLVAFDPATSVVTGLPNRKFGVDSERAVSSVVIDQILWLGRNGVPTGMIGRFVELVKLLYPLDRIDPLAVGQVLRTLAKAADVSVDSLDVLLESPELLAARTGDRRELVVVSEVEDVDGQQQCLVSTYEESLELRSDGSVLILDQRQRAEALATLCQSSRSRIVPSAFGLPGCPPTEQLFDLWAGLHTSDIPRSLPTAVVVELVSRGLIQGDNLEFLRSEAEAADKRTAEVLALLSEVLDRALQVAAVPVVIGDLVDMVDGGLPEHFVNPDRLEMLVDAEVTGALVEQLECIGLVRSSRTVTVRNLETATSVVLRRDKLGPEVEICRTLATGPFGVLVDPHEFHALSVPVRGGGRWFRALHPAHRFIHSCLRYERSGGVDYSLARSVVTNAPRPPALCAQMFSLSERLGATASVRSVVEEVDGLLPGIPPALLSMVRGRAIRPKRTRRLGRRP